jgi:hypothetical protein
MLKLGILLIINDKLISVCMAKNYMGYFDLMKTRLVSTYKGFGFSVRIMLQARKKLPKPKNAIYLVLVLLPLLAVILVNNPIFALTWLICLLIYYPIIDAYAYAVVNGGN